jgi:hypothetical protein
MHDDRGLAETFRAPLREPKLGIFHRTAHGIGIKPAAEAVQPKLSGPMAGEQRLGEGAAHLPLSGSSVRTKELPAPGVAVAGAPTGRSRHRGSASG